MLSNPLADFPTYKNWAVVGVSADTSKFGYKIYQDLKRAGYVVVGVNPKLDALDGDTVYASLRDLPTVPEVVNVVVPPAAGLAVVEDCLALDIKNIWFQPGAESDEAIARAKAGGMIVVDNACIMIEKKAFA